jgi:phospholipid transport system substrate-binding protein
VTFCLQIQNEPWFYDFVDVEIEVTCSAGTYIRAIARDLGDVLNVGGHLTQLRRTHVGTFTIDNSITSTELKNGKEPKVMQLVDSQLMPHVNFRRMTALATGPAWRSATPEQQKRLQDEFKVLLVRTYSGALSQITDQVVVVKPLRAGQEDKNLVVNTEVRGKSDPIQLDYRLEKTPGQGSGWMIFDLNVLGVWLVENYRNQFTKEINAGGIDALIASLAARNKSNAKAS